MRTSRHRQRGNFNYRCIGLLRTPQCLKLADATRTVRDAAPKNYRSDARFDMEKHSFLFVQRYRRILQNYATLPFQFHIPILCIIFPLILRKT